MENTKETLALAPCLINSMCKHYFTLTVALADTKNLPWYHENYNNIFFVASNDMEVFDYCGNHIRSERPCDVVHVSEVNWILFSCIGDLTNFVIDSISNGTYVLFNRIDIGKLLHIKTKELSDVMVYGYDLTKQVFYLSYICETVKRGEICFWTLETIMNYHSSEFPFPYPLTLLARKKTFMSYPFSIEQFAKQLHYYLNGTAEQDVSYYNSLVINGNTNVWFGMNVYAVIIDKIEKAIGNGGVGYYSLVNFKVEHSLKVIDSINFLFERHYIDPCEEIQEILEPFKTIALRTRNLALKICAKKAGTMRGSKEEHRLIAAIIKMQENEKELLNRVEMYLTKNLTLTQRKG